MSISNCKECGRPLSQDEHDLCPACKSNKSHKKKRWFEIIAGTVTVVGGIVAILTGGGKTGKKS